MGEDAEVGFLHHIFSVLVVVENAAGDAKEPLVVATRQLADRIIFATLAPAQQLIIRERGAGGQVWIGESGAGIHADWMRGPCERFPASYS